MVLIHFALVLLVAPSAEGSADEAETDGRVRVTIETVAESRIVRLTRIGDDGELGERSECRTPCRLALVAGLYRAFVDAGPRERAFSTKVAVPKGGGTIRIGDEPKEVAAPVEDDSRVARGVGLIALGVAALHVGALVEVLGYFAENPFCFFSSCTPSSGTVHYALGALVIGGGIAALVGGGVLLGRPATRYSFSIAPTGSGAMASAGVRF